ncbi:uncharacterized protein DUF2029 [Diaminobutyricimonas aerilata]|uniref:Uncharacterized protein DUF2029 n=1 Tax=Diaminobutyricimonas aerilata TaxID=1162967 RepID=A0A2M9CLM4_9MICO|nr:glycosyltransferase 87 family protein [Diaminobutyricimonas aerilata]PJJ72779.1 uncharacterized protein DUF2029 [Diaminobutyricimonas aerilata]
MTHAPAAERIRHPLAPLVGQRAAAWAAFCVLHLGYGLVALFHPSLPMGDVTLVYKYWVEQAFTNDFWVGVDGPWVYPIGALAPMLVAHAFGPALYASTWLTIVLLLDAVALAALLGLHGPLRHGRAAWWWLAFLALLGPIALSRIDAVTVPLGIVAATLVLRHPRVAGALFVLGAWVKVWPAALFAALLVAARHRAPLLGVAVVTSSLVVLVPALYGAGTELFSFITTQTGRGLQIEAPVSTWWMWRAWAVDPSLLYYDRDILTFQIRGPGVDIASALTTPLMLVVVAGIVVLGIRAAARGAALADLLAPLSLALVTALIVVNKVGSPQFASWLAVPVVLWLVTGCRGARVPVVLVLAIAALTHVVYPYLYGHLLALEPLMLAMLTLRNALLVVLLGWAVARLARVRPRH